MNFDQRINRRQTHAMKWDSLQALYGLSPDSTIPMWVADMDFLPPDAVNSALQQAINHGIHGYFGDERAHKSAVCHWMQTRHQWAVDPDWILTAHGLVAAVALCLQAYTQVGDGIILFTPVYHAFARTIKANQRLVVESPLVLENGLYRMDLAALKKQLTGREKMLILCSPHNPGGRVWSVAELKALAAFCIEHNLLLVSDEIHHDLVYSPAQHTVMPLAAPECRERLIMLTSTTKTFNIAGGMTGNAIIENATLRTQFTAALMASGSSPNRLGVLMATAAYQHGAAWLDELLPYLNQNRLAFDAGVNQIQGVHSMSLEATYLAWVNFAGTGLSPAEVIEKVQHQAHIAPSLGASFGKGGEYYLRFNFACPKVSVLEAVERLQRVFA